MFGNVRDQIIRRNLGEQMPQQAPQAAASQPQGRGTARRVAGFLADALAGLAGQQGPYASMLFREQQGRDEEAAQQRARADAYADFVKREEWKRANPEARTNDTVADYEFIRQTLGDEEAQKFLRNRADPPRYVQGPDMQFYPVQTARSPTAPVGRLTPIDGGPGGSPSGAGFR